MRIRTLFFWLWQCTWGLPQTAAGLVMAGALALRRRPVAHYRAALVVRWGMAASLSLGAVLFVSAAAQGSAARRLAAHEYGHSLQSLLLGPLYLPVVVLPSALWCNLPAAARHRAQTGRSYYNFFTERWANHLAARLTGEDVPQ